MTISNKQRVVVAFDNRKRAKDATLAIQHVADEDDVSIKVYVIGNAYKKCIIECDYESFLEDKIDTVFALARKSEVPPIEEVIEFYQGAGLSRFRGQ